ncbi:hypothetical protein A9490_27860 [Bacillus thuringiensis]|uniref:hypothetical protein n=1 Tax=Bacillus thuringiensis TaxID=1428 RepID=UPI0008FE1620|nr:hypothetical protein [Bacillus thuringiensis]OJE28339.1 hypothetical protein A9490_27860 [Bacillus thuringiensis]
MEARTTADGNTFIIEVARQNSSRKSKIGRFFSLLMGLTCLFFSSILFFTIIGIFFAIPLFGIGLGFLYVAFDKQEVVCPNCGAKRRIAKRGTFFDCGTCKKRTLVEWDK